MFRHFCVTYSAVFLFFFCTYEQKTLCNTETHELEKSFTYKNANFTWLCKVYLFAIDCEDFSKQTAPIMKVKECANILRSHIIKQHCGKSYEP